MRRIELNGAGDMAVLQKFPGNVPNSTWWGVGAVCPLMGLYKEVTPEWS